MRINNVGNDAAAFVLAEKHEVRPGNFGRLGAARHNRWLRGPS